MDEQTKDALVREIREAVDTALKPFYIDREEHYQHHKFIGKLMDLVDKTAGGACATVAKILVTAVFALLLFGIVFWGKTHILK